MLRTVFVFVIEREHWLFIACDVARVFFFKCMLPDYDFDEPIVAGLIVFLKYMVSYYSFGENLKNVRGR